MYTFLHHHFGSGRCLNIESAHFWSTFLKFTTYHQHPLVVCVGGGTPKYDNTYESLSYNMCEYTSC